MKLSLQPVEIEKLRIDGGTQVREKLCEEWIQELMRLYEEGGHDIGPILIMEDDDGNLWLVDGFHRREALHRLGWSDTKATVRHGSLDAAKFLAAQMNKNGLPRTPGDKKRAILLAVSTKDGKRMGFRELARHVGVHHSYVQEVISGVEVAGTRHPSVENGNMQTEVGPKQKAVAVLWARIDAAIRKDPDRPSMHVAKELECSDRAVRERRKALGFHALPRGGHKYEGKAKAEAILRDHPGWTNIKIAEESGISDELVAKLRKQLGINRPTVVRRKKREPARQSDGSTAGPVFFDSCGGGRASAPTTEDHPAASPIPIRPGGLVSTLRTDAMRLVEKMNREDREGFARDLLGRWPEIFHGLSPHEATA
ncbi:MAG TPA: ParB N-terminal domain-containing protein [Kofleriaceae bacterium]|nr:ParB N-terminal domain-containing protein [Kofleriaceae bacterium]